MNSEQDRRRREAEREREADAIEADIDHLDRSRRAMVATARRLRGPVDVDKLAGRAEAGRELTSSEQAILAAEAPDAFTAYFEGRCA